MTTQSPKPNDAVMMVCQPPIENQHQLHGSVIEVRDGRALIAFGARITRHVAVADMSFEPVKPWLERERWVTTAAKSRALE